MDYNTNRDWFFSMKKVMTLVFQKDAGMFEGMPYLHVHGNHNTFMMIQTVREKFGMFTEKQVDKAIE